MRSTPILTDEMGHPFVRPLRADYETDLDWMYAWYAYRDAVVGSANRAFMVAFRKAVNAEQ